MTIEVSVTAQASRNGKRWAYVLHLEPAELNYVSKARWGSPEAAIAAGEADLAMSADLNPPPFAEGDKVRNILFEMGVGTITRHSLGPLSVRWHDGHEAHWWVAWPDFRDPKWVDPHALGTAGWYRESALEPAEAAPASFGSATHDTMTT